VFDSDSAQSRIDFDAPFNKHSWTHDTRGRRNSTKSSAASTEFSQQITIRSEPRISRGKNYLPLLALTSPSRIHGKILTAHVNARLMTSGRLEEAKAWILNSLFSISSRSIQNQSISSVFIMHPNHLFNRFDHLRQWRPVLQLARCPLAGLNPVSFYTMFFHWIQRCRHSATHVKFCGWDYQKRKWMVPTYNFFTHSSATEGGLLRIWPNRFPVDLSSRREAQIPKTISCASATTQQALWSR